MSFQSVHNFITIISYVISDYIATVNSEYLGTACSAVGPALVDRAPLHAGPAAPVCAATPRSPSAALLLLFETTAAAWLALLHPAHHKQDIKLTHLFTLKQISENLDNHNTIS